MKEIVPEPVIRKIMTMHDIALLMLCKDSGKKESENMADFFARNKGLEKKLTATVDGIFEDISSKKAPRNAIPLEFIHQYMSLVTDMLMKIGNIDKPAAEERLLGYLKDQKAIYAKGQAMGFISPF